MRSALGSGAADGEGGAPFTTDGVGAAPCTAEGAEDAPPEVLPARSGTVASLVVGLQSASMGISAAEGMLSARCSLASSPWLRCTRMFPDARMGPDTMLLTGVLLTRTDAGGMRLMMAP